MFFLLKTQKALTLQQVAGKEIPNLGKKLQKFQYLENKNNFLDKIKKSFIDFGGLPFGEQQKFDNKW